MKGLPESWNAHGLNTVCLQIIDCINKTAPTVDIPTPFRMIRTTNVKEGRINLEGARYVDENTFRKWTRRTALKSKDVVLTREAPLGEVGLLRSNEKLFLGQRTMVYRANPNLLDQIFLYYSFISYTIQAQIRSLGSGSTVEHLRVPHAETLKILLPPLPIQRKIAAVLSAYDDLIENNTRRIAILEKMAEELYREWFVRLRFPGHEKTKIVKGVPEGWEILKMAEVISYYIGGGWGEDSANIEFPLGAYVIRGTDIPDLDKGSFEKPPFRYHKESNYSSRSLKVGDVVFEVSGGSKDQLLGRSLLITKGIHSLCDGKLIAASFCKQIRPKPGAISCFFFNYFLKSYYRSGQVGTYQIQSTGISNYQFEDFLKYQGIVLPDFRVQQEFESVVGHISGERDALAKKNILLRTSRDRLLSRLMSGKIDLENLDIHSPPSMREEELAHA